MDKPQSGIYCLVKISVGSRDVSGNLLKAEKSAKKVKPAFN